MSGLWMVRNKRMNPAHPRFDIQSEINDRISVYPGWHYVYLLANDRTKWLYIGCTSNLEKRISEHNKGKVFTTKKILPVWLLYYEAFNCKESAYMREKGLKNHGSGLAKLKARIGWAG